ncbi:MAG: serine O-acetyltransferase [Chitinophagales bacterium]
MFQVLKEDMAAFMARDPAARGYLEIFLCYPGFHAILFHRLAHALFQKRWFLAARLVSQFSRAHTQIEIHPGATIGQRFFIDHGAGVVIGETAEIGDDVTIYQGVTLGGTGKEKGKRHPTIGNGVVISTGAKVLGSIAVGDNAKIGAGSVVLRNVPPGCTVVGVPGKIAVNNGTRIKKDSADVDLEHNILPDPISDTLQALQDRIMFLERKLEILEKEVEHDTGLQHPKQAQR